MEVMLMLMMMKMKMKMRVVNDNDDRDDVMVERAAMQMVPPRRPQPCDDGVRAMTTSDIERVSISRRVVVMELCVYVARARHGDGDRRDHRVVTAPRMDHDDDYE